MKNKKILKLLASITLGSALGLTLAGCGHEHDFSGKWQGEETGHYHVCPDDGEKDEMKPHVDADKDGYCDACGWKMNTVDEGDGSDHEGDGSDHEGDGSDDEDDGNDGEGDGSDDEGDGSDDEGDGNDGEGDGSDGEGDGSDDEGDGSEGEGDGNEGEGDGNEGEGDGNEGGGDGEVVTQYTVTFHMNGHGSAIDNAEVENGGTLVKPADPTDDNYTFIGWYTDAECTQVFDFSTSVTGDLELYALWELKIEYKDVTYEFSPSNLEPDVTEDKTYEDGFTSGIFSVLPGTTVRKRGRSNQTVLNYKDDSVYATGFTATKSVKYDSANAGFSINAIAPGTLVLYVENGSTVTVDGVKQNVEYQSFVLTRPDNSTETITYKGTGIFAVIIECDVEGVYKITRGSNGTSDIYYASFETSLPVTPVEKIEIVDEGLVEYFVGQELDLSLLKVQLVHETTGLCEPVDLEALDIDTSAYNSEVAGTYDITVSYTVDGKKFSASFSVVVTGVESIELGLNKIVKGNNTSAGNGTYINHAVRQFYFKGEEFSEDGLTVTTVSGDIKSVVTEGYNISFDSSVAGKQIVSVSWGETSIHSDIVVYVADYTVADVNKNVQNVTINVNGGLDDSKVGAYENGAYCFKTIQQALEFLNAVNYDKNTKKVINVAEGYYKEKVEINIPNLTIRGASDDAEKTVIEWDALYGLKDESGFEHLTDSTATLNVRESAEGFVIENITISNWFNSEEHFTEALGAGYSEHRALAVLIQADKVVMDNCRMLGYQDTLELFTGRQVIMNSYINGRTDFIFGTNNTTYFYNCEIESILGGGYITAFKGINKGESDFVTYGAIFDECEFTCSAGVATGTTAIARPWDAYSAVAVINSDLGSHISLKGYDGSSGTRYVAMSNTITPILPTIKFVEYNNTGAGAIEQAVAGMSMLTASEATLYNDMSVIFGTENGNLTYSTSWDGAKGVEITEKTYLFSDYYVAGDAYNTYHSADNDELYGGDATVVSGSWGHQLNQAKDHAQFSVGSVIKFNVAGKVTVKTFGSGYGEPENVSISYKDGYATLTIVTTKDSPLNNGCYITQIKLDMATIPEDTVVEPVFSGDTVIDLLGITASYEGDTGVYEGIIIDATNGKFALNTTKDWVQMTEGTVLKVQVAEGMTVKVTEYEEGSIEVGERDEDGWVTITAIGNTYLSTIILQVSQVRITSDYTYTYEQNGRADGDIEAGNEYIKFDNCKVNNVWLKYGTITLDVAEGATIKITGSQYDGNVTVNGEQISCDNGYIYTYTVSEAGTVVISSSVAYLKKIEVTF